MKKGLLFISLSLLSTTLVGCDFDTKPITGNVVRIELSGKLKQTKYNWEDTYWNVAGIKYKVFYEDGTSHFASIDNFNITCEPSFPRGYGGYLTIYAGLKTNNSIRTFSTVTGLEVTPERYDYNAEVNNYYKNVNLNLTGDSLKTELHKKMFDTHTTWINYGKVSQYYNVNDKHASIDQNYGDENVQMFYNGRISRGFSGNKEHVWACADSNGLWSHEQGSANYVTSTYVGGGSDLYHIRPIDEMINTARGDALFVQFNQGSYSGNRVTLQNGGPDGVIFGQYSGSSSAPQYARYCEPPNSMKGDVARILAYVYMHYDRCSSLDSSYNQYCGNLYMNDVIASVSLLKAWNQLDPVSEVEKYRNHTVMQIQGNRNPFVDYPDLLNKISY